MSDVRDQPKLASVDPEPNEFWLARIQKKVPLHSVCGATCEYEEAPTASGKYFGVRCPRCNRSLMVGEVQYVNPG